MLYRGLPSFLSPFCFTAAIAAATLLAPVSGFGQTVVPEVAASVGSDPLATGRVIAKPQTPQYDLVGLVNKSAGQPSEAAFAKYAGDIDAYWQAAEKSRMGKSFEAVFAYQENARLAATGAKNRILVSAAENLPHHGADLVMIDEAGRVTRQFQAKTGWQNLQQALSDSRYATMEIVTDNESLTVLNRELAKAENNAARRGLSLADEWKAVRRAIDEGRLLQRTPSGAPLPTRAYVEQEARAALEVVWKRMSGAAAEAAEKAKALNAAARAERTVTAGADDAARAGERIARAATQEAGDVAIAACDAGNGATKAAVGAAEATRTASKALHGTCEALAVVGVVVDAGVRINDAVAVEQRFAKRKSLHSNAKLSTRRTQPVLWAVGAVLGPVPNSALWAEALLVVRSVLPWVAWRVE